MTQDDKSHLSDQEIYEMLDKYRMGLKTAALTTLDIKTFIDKNPAYQVEPKSVLKSIVLGNACSWNSYEIARKHYEKHFLSFRHEAHGQM